MASVRLLGLHSVTPVPLYRLQGGAQLVRLRVQASVLRRGRTDFDIIAGDDGLVGPCEPTDARYLKTNGMALLAKDIPLAVGAAFGNRVKTVCFEVPAGTPIPPELALFHIECVFGETFSLRPTARMTVARLNALLTAFLRQPAVTRIEGKPAFYARFPELHPDVMGFSKHA